MYVVYAPKNVALQGLLLGSIIGNAGGLLRTTILPTSLLLFLPLILYTQIKSI